MKKINSTLTIIASENGYHPIKIKLEGLVWDVIHWIRSCLHHFLGAAVVDWFSDHIRHLDNHKVFQRSQGHWIMEISEIMATNHAKALPTQKRFRWVCRKIGSPNDPWLQG